MCNQHVDYVFLSVQMATKDKSTLQAQVASLLKENLDLTRSKKILQAKVCNKETYIHFLNREVL